MRPMLEFLVEKTPDQEVASHGYLRYLLCCKTRKYYFGLRALANYHQHPYTLLLPLSDHRHLVDYAVTVFGVRLIKR